MELLLSTKQVATRWSVSLKHVYTLAARGDLRSIRIGEVIRFRPQDVEDYENREATPPALAPEPPPPGDVIADRLSGASRAGYIVGLRLAAEKERRKA